MKILKKRKMHLTVLSIFIALLGVVLLTVIFGIDQKLLQTPLQGKVLSTSGVAIEGAEVVIQKQIVKTDNEGKFYFEDVRFGNYEVSVSKNGFTSYRNTWTINRFKNLFEVSLKPEEFGEVQFNFNTEGAATDSIEVLINKMTFPVEKTENGFILNSGRLLTGIYLLEVTSPSYVDIEKRVEVNPGFANEVVVLYPAADLVAEFKDYINLQPLHPDMITVNGVVPSVEESWENKLELKDIDITKKLKIDIQHKGYLKQTIEMKLEQGTNSLGQIPLVPENRVLLTDKQTIKSAQFDGTLQKEVFRGEGNCEIKDRKANVYLVQCGIKTIAVIQENGEYRLLREYNGKYEIFDLLSTDNSIVAVSQNRREILLIKSTGNFSVVLNHGREILSMVTDHTGNIYFSDDEGIYGLIATRSGETVEVIKGRYFLEDVSTDGSKLIALSHDASQQNNMWLIDIENGGSERLSFLPSYYQDPRFITDDSIFYIENDVLRFRGLASPQSEEVLRGVENPWVDFDNSIFFGYKSDSKSIVFATRQTKMEKEIETFP